MLGNQAVEERVGPKPIAQKAFLGGRHRIRRPLKGRQGANKGQNLWGIGRGCSRESRFPYP